MYHPKHRRHRTKRNKKRHYAEILPITREVAKSCGYAIAVHGSMTRDLDLVAVPWIEKHLKAETLVLRIEKAVCEHAFIGSIKSLRKIQRCNAKTEKHGNVGENFIITTGADTYLDLLVVAAR